MTEQLWIEAPEIRPATFPPVWMRVKAGIQHLDDRIGHHWRDRIDLNVFDMENPDEDLLAQVFNSFDVGCSALGISRYKAAHLGFCVLHQWEPGANKEIRVLSHVWRRFFRVIL